MQNKKRLLGCLVGGIVLAVCVGCRQDTPYSKQETRNSEGTSEDESGTGQMSQKERNRLYDQLDTLVWEAGGGFGEGDEMTSLRWTFSFRELTVQCVEIKNADGSIVSLQQGSMSQEELDALARILKKNDFFALPEELETPQAAEDGELVRVTVTANGLEHHCSGRVSTHQEFSNICTAIEVAAQSIFGGQQ